MAEGMPVVCDADETLEERVRDELEQSLAAGRLGDVESAGAHWRAFVALVEEQKEK